MKTYDKPQIEELGALHELTLADGPNKVGGNPDIYSNIVPIVGSIVPQR